MVKIEGWYKNYENSNEIMWTQNKYNPLRLKAYKSKNIWYLYGLHQSFENGDKLLEKTISKTTIKMKATKIMKGMTISPLNQRIRSKLKM